MSFVGKVNKTAENVVKNTDLLGDVGGDEPRLVASQRISATLPH